MDIGLRFLIIREFKTALLRILKNNFYYACNANKVNYIINCRVFVQFWILIDILLKIRNGIRSIFEILDFKFL